VDVETDKAAVTIPSPRSGLVRSVVGKPGDLLHTGQVICVIDDSGTGEASSSLPLASPPAGRGIPSSPSAPTPTPVGRGPLAPPHSPATARKPVAAPATRRLARELGVDLALATPTGRGGRLTDEDVRRAATAPAPSPPAGRGIPSPPRRALPASPSTAPGPDGEPPAASMPSVGPIPLLDLSPLPDFAAWGPVRREPLRSIRRKTAIRMVTSATLVPHVAHLEDIDVTELEAMRRPERDRRRGGPGGHLTLTAFVMKAVALGLRDHPSFNASLDPFAGEIIFKDYVHVGVALDSGRGLIVPVLRDADQMGIVALSDRVADLGRRGREGTLSADELRGGTFTITNIGFLGGTGLMPLVNYPEVAILGLARAAPKPVVRDGQVVVRTILPVVLSFDHRVADGADAARFVNDLKRRLEHPLELLLEA
jgi:pyruvate dehydrogenase E2 component (dihydrolipoamide acetyltransferase)